MQAGDLPEQIGPYRVLRPIARGGMAEVYEVEDPPTGEHFALKLLMEAGPARKRFDREYEAMTRLNHPSIVRVYNYGFHGAAPWLTMELLGGLTVQAYAKRIGKPGATERVAEVVRIAHDLARALDHIHRRGLIHRDLKSDNVLVLPDGRVKLLDFGAAHVQQAMEQITREGEFLGTFAYASPEQFLGRGIDHRSDLYSLGVLLYRLSTGRRPFWSDDHHALAKQHVTQAPRPPRQITPSLPPELERIILWLLEKKPRNRPNSGAKVADALEALAGQSLFLPGTLDVSAAAGALVGREEQVRQVRMFLDAGTPGGVALVLGQEGSGRQTVMDMCRVEAEKRGWEVWDAWGRPGKGVLPLVEMMSSAVDTLQLSLPRIDAAREEIQHILDRGLRTERALREAFYRDCATTLRARVASHGQGIALMVWDLHEMGPETITALRILREECQRTRAPLLIIAGSEDAERSLREQGVHELGEAVRIALPPMGVGQTAVLVGALLHRRPPPTALARRIHAASGGLPDFVNEVLSGLVNQGMLRVKGDDANRLDWAQQELDIPVPRGAQRATRTALQDLPAEAQRVLEALCLVGGETTAVVIAWALEREEPEVSPVLELLEEGGFVVTYVDDDGDTWVRWRHELLGQAVLYMLHPTRRCVLRRRLMIILEDAPTFAAQIRIMLEEDRIDAAVERALEWGKLHLNRHEPMTALEVLDPVVARLQEAAGSSSEERAGLLLLQVRCALLARPGNEAIRRTLAMAAKYIAAGNTHGQLASELQLLRAQYARSLGEYADFRRYLSLAWKHTDKVEMPAFASAVARTMGLSKRMNGEIAKSGSWYQRGWKLAESSGDELTMAEAQVGLATWVLAHGSVREAEKMAYSSLAYFEQTGNARGISSALPVWTNALRYQGRFSEALVALRRHLPVLKAGEAPTNYVRLALATAWCEADLCRLGRAQESVEELHSTLRRGEHLHLQLEAELVAGRVQLQSSQLGEAIDTLEGVVERASAAELVYLSEHARGLLGEAYAADGHFPIASKAFHQSMTSLRDHGDTFTLAAVATAQVRAMAEREDPSESYATLRAWIDENGLEGVRMEFLIAHARYLTATGGDPSPVWGQARDTLRALGEKLEDTERAVLRVHPWSRAVLHGTSG